MGNPRILYHELFESIPPYEDVMDALLCTLQVTTEDIESAFRAITQENDEISMDENFFTAIYMKLLDHREQWTLSALRSFAVTTRSGCNKAFTTDCFFSNTSFTLTQRCYKCRSETKTCEVPTVVNAKLSGRNLTSDMFVSVYKTIIEAARHLSYPTEVLCVAYDCLFDLTVSEPNDTGHDCSALPDNMVGTTQQEFLSIVQKIEKYTYIVHQRASGTRKSESYICSQRRTKQPNMNRPIKRHRQSKKEMDCGGFLSFSYGRGYNAVARVKHERHHEKLQKLPPLNLRAPGAEREIKVMIEAGMTPFQICEHIRRMFKVEFQYH
ncbi:hypothetical protein FGB62_188g02 [Gracilaria domingensis]|nr:hypothetical protein FGB62_188g02 [Gracilaria domingensis]